MSKAIYKTWMNSRIYVEPKQLPSHILKLDSRYQRKIDMKRVQAIVDNYNPCVVNPLKVSHRDGKYYVFDGSHTLMALKKINANKESFLVECRVYENLTFEEECALFAAQFGICKPISVQSEINALWNAGDPDILAWIRATEKAGLSLAIKGNTDGTIRALGKAKSLYQKYGENLYVDALTLIRDTWGGCKSSLTAHMLGGVCLFLREFGDEYNRGRFINKLMDNSPERIRISAKLKKASYQTMDVAFATEIAQLYNYKAGKYRLDLSKTFRMAED